MSPILIEKNPGMCSPMTYVWWEHKKNPGITFLTALLATGAILFGLEKIGPRRDFCETYQGYTESDVDVSVNYVFDPKTKEERGLLPAMYGIKGDPKLKNILKKGVRYCGSYRDPIVSWGQNFFVNDLQLSNLQQRDASREDMEADSLDYLVNDSEPDSLK